MVDNMTKDWKGYLIARQLFNESNQLQDYAFYPRIKGGKPPFLYKTKKQAMRIWNKGKHTGILYKTKVVKFKKSMYLDRF
jgi:hypothetical protein